MAKACCDFELGSMPKETRLLSHTARNRRITQPRSITAKQFFKPRTEDAGPEPIFYISYCICQEICKQHSKELTERGIPSPAGKSVWYSGTVESILTNEKYKGMRCCRRPSACIFCQRDEAKRGRTAALLCEIVPYCDHMPEVFDAK